MSLLAKKFEKMRREFGNLFENRRYLWVSVGITLFLFVFSLFIQLNNPLATQFNNSSSKIDFIPEARGVSDADFFESLDLFDSAPLFVPTKWNHSSIIIPKKKIFYSSNFPEFNPKIDLNKQLSLSIMGDQLPETKREKSLLDGVVDLRILGLSERKAPLFEGNRTSVVQVEALNQDPISRNKLLFFPYEISFNPAMDSSDPVILLVKNNNVLKSRPLLFSSSSVDEFDSKVLAWANNSAEIAKLPKGLLKLTFYP